MRAHQILSASVYAEPSHGPSSQVVGGAHNIMRDIPNSLEDPLQLTACLNGKYWRGRRKPNSVQHYMVSEDSKNVTFIEI